jgi:CubicO group peptidase (beta-lactamase class C family)
MPTREAMKYLALDPLVFEPGSGWNYSLGHDVLAAVVEVVSGKRFGLYVKEKIFDPLGMKHSTFLLPENELGEIAAQYRYDPETRRYNRCGPEIRSHKLGTEYESGGAGCISTVDDYMLFLENLRSGERLLKRGTIARMTCPQVSKAIEKQYWGCNYHSYGLGVRCPKPGTGFYDYGWSGAAGAFLAIIPDADVSIYSAQHVLNSPASAIHGELCVKVLKDLN